MHSLGLGGREGGIPGFRSLPKGAAFLTSFNNHRSICELSCCSTANLRITALLRLGGTTGDHPGQAPCSKQVQLGQAGIASKGQCLVEHVMPPQELQEGHKRGELNSFKLELKQFRQQRWYPGS